MLINRRGILLISFLLIALFLIMSPRLIDIINTRSANSKGEPSVIHEIELPHSSQIIYEKFNEGILQYWDGILYYHDMKGQQQWTIHLGVISPIIRTTNNNVYIMDNNKKQLIRLGKDGEVQYKVFLDKGVYNFSANDKQNVLLQLINEGGSYRKLLILNDEGKKTGEISIAEGEIMSFSIEDNDSKILLHTLNTANNRIEGNLLQYDRQGKLIKLDSLEDKLLLRYYTEGKGNLILVFEDGIRAIDNEGSIKWEVEAAGIKDAINEKEEYLAIYSNETQKSGIIYGKSQDRLNVIAQSGNSLSDSILKEKPSGMDTNKNELLYYSTRSLYIVNKKGQQIAEYKYNSDIEKAFLYQQQHVIVITKERLTFLKI